MAHKQLQVVLTTGTGSPQRARLALEAALAAVAGGLDVALFLTLDAVDWACAVRRPGQDDDVHLLLAQLRDLGVAIACCARCAVVQCADVSQPIGLAPGIEALGLTQLMEKVANGVPTVTF